MTELDWQIQETTAALLELVVQGFGKDVDLLDLGDNWWEEWIAIANGSNDTSTDNLSARPDLLQ